MRRPDVFTLDYGHPLAQGLVFAGVVGSGDVTGAVTDKSIRRVPIIRKSGSSVSHIRQIEQLGRHGFFTRSISDSYSAATPAAKVEPCTFAAWLDWDVNRSPNSSGCSLGIPGGYAQLLGIGLHGFWNGSTTVPRVRVLKVANVDTFEIGTGPGYTLAHVCAVFASNADRRLYINGIHVASFTTSVTASVSGSTVQIGSDGSYSFHYGLIADPCIYNRILSPSEIAVLADSTDPMLGGFIVEERPVLYFDLGGGTTDELTASNLTISAPVLGAPTLGQIHALTASGLTVEGPVLGAPDLAQIHALTAQNFTASSPVLGAPVVGQVHVLIATGLTVSTPVLGNPAIGQTHVLTATGLVVSSPALGTPAIGQVHSLTAQNFATGSPVLGTPALTENAADVDALTANALVVGSPALGSPSLGQIHVLGCDGLMTGSPVLGHPSMVQVHALSALGLTVGVPVLGTPAFNGSDIVLITADEVARVVSSQSRMKIVMAASRQKQVIYAVS